jgi:hypothetical protein
MTDAQIEHAGHTYRVEPIDVLTQLHLARRMSGAMVETIAEGVRKGDASMLLPEVVAWGAMSDADVEFFVNACMGAVRRKDPQRETWQPVWNVQARRCMFDDIDHKHLMHLVREVLRIRIGPFLPEVGPRESDANPAEAG